MVFGKRLRQLRKEHHLTQSQLGSKLNLAESTVSLYESGKRSPDNQTLLLIGSYFGVSTDYLLGGTNRPNPVYYKYSSPIMSLCELPGCPEHIREALYSAIEKNKEDHFFWYCVSNFIPGSVTIMPGDELLIQRNAKKYEVGDHVFLEKTHCEPRFYEVQRTEFPVVLVPWDQTEEKLVFYGTSLEKLPFANKVIEARRILSPIL